MGWSGWAPSQASEGEETFGDGAAVGGGADAVRDAVVSAVDSEGDENGVSLVLAGDEEESWLHGGFEMVDGEELVQEVGDQATLYLLRQ